jgi:hypothetical protein
VQKCGDYHLLKLVYNNLDIVTAQEVTNGLLRLTLDGFQTKMMEFFDAGNRDLELIPLMEKYVDRHRKRTNPLAGNEGLEIHPL